MKTNDLLITRPTEAVPFWGIHQKEKSGLITVISQANTNRLNAEVRAKQLGAPFKSDIYMRTKRGNYVLAFVFPYAVLKLAEIPLLLVTEEERRRRAQKAREFGMNYGSGAPICEGEHSAIKHGGISLGTLGHVDHSKTTLTAIISRYSAEKGLVKGSVTGRITTKKPNYEEVDKK